MSGPLGGCRVVVCRAVDQSARLLALLAGAGAVPIHLPLVEVLPPVDGGADLAAALDRLDRYDWVLFTSANGVRAVRDRLGGRSWPAAVQAGSVGPATTAAAEAAGIPVALARPGGTGGDLAAELTAARPPARALLPAAELARPELADGLRRAGWDVDVVVAYRTARPAIDPARRAQLGGADAVLFTAPSTVDRFLEVAGPTRVPPLVVCIGASTARRARERDVAVSAVATEQGDDGLVDALCRLWPRPDGEARGGPMPGGGA